MQISWTDVNILQVSVCHLGTLGFVNINHNLLSSLESLANLEFNYLSGIKVTIEKYRQLSTASATTKNSHTF